MTDQEVATISDPLIRASLAAMRRAASKARDIAIQTNTAIVIVRDGKMVEISADELRRSNPSS